MLPDRSRVMSELPMAAAKIATVMAHAIGNSGTDGTVLRGYAIRLLKRWLDSTELHIDLDSSLVDYGLQGEAKTEWRSHLKDWPKRSTLNHSQSLSAIMLPLDGASSLSDGRAGSMTWLAVSKRNGLSRLVAAAPPDSDSAEASYFALTLGPQSMLNDARAAVAALHNQVAVTADTSLADFLRTNAALCEILTGQDDRRKPTRPISTLPGKTQRTLPLLVAAHTLEIPAFRQAHPPLGVHVLNRRLDGSPVVSAIAALTGRTDIGYCVCRLPALGSMVAAARAVGGAVLAVPLRGASSAIQSRVYVPANAPFIHGDTLFDANAEVVLAGASITELCVSDRVQWHGPPESRLPRSAVDSGPPSRSQMSVHSIVFDSANHLREERTLDWDASCMRCFGNESLLSTIQRHQEEWQAAHRRNCGLPQ